MTLSHAAPHDDALRHALEPYTLDGTEAHKTIRDLTDAVLGAKGDIAGIAEAEAIAQLRLQRLLEGYVHVEDVLNVIARLQEHQTLNFDFGEVMRSFAEQQIRMRAAKKKEKRL
jgi:hypothetical protein